MTRLILIRHGETDWNLEGRWQGQADISLNDHGREQAEQLALELVGAGITAIYASDLGRARETAESLSQATGLPICFDVRLREIHQGEWQGLRWEEIQARYAQPLAEHEKDPFNVAPPGGETVNQVKARVLAALAEILKDYPRETVALVSHGFALALLLVHLNGEPIEEVWELIPKNGQWQVIEVNTH